MANVLEVRAARALVAGLATAKARAVIYAVGACLARPVELGFLPLAGASRVIGAISVVVLAELEGLLGSGVRLPERSPSATVGLR